MELSQKKINKLIAIQSLVQKGDEAVIEKILEFNDTLEDLLETYGTEIENVRQTISDIQSLKSEIEIYVSTKDTELSDKLSEMPSQLDTLKSMLEDKMSEGEMSHKEHAMKMEATVAKLAGEISAIKASIQEMPNMNEYVTFEQLKASIPPTLPPTEVTGEEVVNKINDLPTKTDEFKIDKSHIKGIAELEAEIRLLKSRSSGSNASIAGRDLFKDIDISSQLDGVTKTFNLPAVWNIISVNLSSFPFGALRKGIDFTYTPTSITFTSEIDAASQLSTGQSCILTVVTS